jgi:hypothetical protein
LVPQSVKGAAVRDVSAHVADEEETCEIVLIFRWPLALPLSYIPARS